MLHFFSLGYLSFMVFERVEVETLFTFSDSSYIGEDFKAALSIDGR